MAKRIEDLVLGTMLLVLMLPLMVVIAAAIRLDTPGPVLFRQKRRGLNNRAFDILKFRTMVHVPDPEPTVPQARRKDPRVTRVGRVLRRTSLDELPQLLNVLKGEMSLVGPRPHALAHDARYAALIDGYEDRHRVPPGITGWAQVHGHRGETDTLEKMQRRVEHDLFYLANRSLLFDLRILVLTVTTVWRDRNAY
jgi:exopolysaccharide biosynthesis polyprenyl glycosylphosphotransferase